MAVRGLGTAINVATVLAGTTTGLVVRKALPKYVRDSVPQALGIFTLALGLRQSLQTSNVLITLGGITSGVLAGSWLRLDERLQRLLSRSESRVLASTAAKEILPENEGEKRESAKENSVHRTRTSGRSRLPRNSLDPAHLKTWESASTSRLSDAIVLPSLVFCVGPMTLIGAIHDGANGQPELLVVKAVMDGFASVAFAAGLGPGVYLSALVILVFQGSLTIAAGLTAPLLSERLVAETTAAGGLIVIAIGIKLLKLKDLPVVDYLPALVTTPIILGLVSALG